MQGIQPAGHRKRELTCHLVHRLDIDILQFHLILCGKRFSEVQGVQYRFFGCGDVEIIDPVESEKKIG